MTKERRPISEMHADMDPHNKEKYFAGSPYLDLEKYIGYPGQRARRHIVIAGARGDHRRMFDIIRRALDFSKDVLILAGNWLGPESSSVSMLNQVFCLCQEIPTHVFPLIGAYEYFYGARVGGRAITTGGLEDVYEQFEVRQREWLNTLPGVVRVRTRGTYRTSSIVVTTSGLEPWRQVTRPKRAGTAFVRYVSSETGDMVNVAHGQPKPSNAVFWTEMYAGRSKVIYGTPEFPDNKVVVSQAQFARCTAVDTMRGPNPILTAYVVESGEVIQ